MNAYQETPKAVLDRLQTDHKKGLSSEEVLVRQARDGKNELREKKKKTWFQMFLDQFRDFLVIILLIAAVISIVTGIIGDEGLVDGLIILAIVLLNAFLGVTQEQRANNALAALKKMTSPHAKVIRDGSAKETPSIDLVVGDIVLLETGDYVSADMRLIESINLKIDESALTGESEAVEKDATIQYETPRLLADRANIAYMSTLVAYGKATGVVTHIGMDSEIGKIATLLDSVQEGKTPLQKTIDEFAKVLGIICIAVSILVFGLGLLQGKDVFTIFLTAIALAVAAIPEGLTAVITVVLALGMQRMVKRHAIIKNLATVETLGQATVICSDKTGTLTQNEMTVKKVFDLTNEYQVQGSGYDKAGRIEQAGKDAEIQDNLEVICQTCLLCNDAKLSRDNKVLGDPTEGALLVLARKAGYELENKLEKYPQLNEYPFDSTRKMMSSIHQIDGVNRLLTKGAADQLIKRCNRIRIGADIRPIEAKDQELINQKIEEYSAQAFRVLGYAYKDVDEPSRMDLEDELIFVGLTAMIDPPRPEAKAAIATCHLAGIRVMMITGDHLATAKAIAAELGILKPGHLALSGEDTAKMSDAEFEDAILHCDVFARSTPQDKIRIVEILQKRKEVVAMTGDGVNDSPALKQADIGVAMGITGTEVSKEASNMILTDDNFASIVSAVEEGRIIYSNIRKFTIYLVSCNIGEILIILFSIIFGFLFQNEIPLVAIHLLWINLMTDSFPAFALGLEKGDPDIMKQKPREPQEKLLNKRTFLKIMIQGTGLMIASLCSFLIGLHFLPEATLTQARTMIFVTVVLGELLRTYSSRSETQSIFKMNPFSNRYVNLAVFFSIVLLLLLIYIPPIASLFRIEALNAVEFVIAGSLGFVPLLFGELTKIFTNRPTN
ncbi:MAG: calcium-translocating P-type ATPase, PMCA-type [Candidatus Izemoplasmatales bacterium]|nr:calcium-translocating P-type ATPase, PMCA-type [Candidatus Izemoplasmatales bacterium]